MPVNTTPRRSPQARRDSTRVERDAAARRAPRRRSRRRAPGARCSSVLVAGSWLLRRAALRGLEALGLVGATRPAPRRAAAPSCAFSAGVGLGGVGLLDQRQLRLRRPGPCELVDGAGARSSTSGENSLQRGQRGVELAAHAVVVDDVLGVVGQRALRRRSPASTRLAVLDDEDLVAGDLDRVVEHRLDEGGASRRRRAPRPRSAPRCARRSRRRRSRAPAPAVSARRRAARAATREDSSARAR